MMRNIVGVVARRALSSVASTSQTVRPLLLPLVGRQGHRTFASPATQQLSELLTTEIAAEKEIYSEKHGAATEVQTKVAGFDLTFDRAEVKLTKTHGGDEQVSISFNVTHTVNPAEEAADEDPNQEGDAEGLSPSMPSFTVEVLKGDRKLAFECEMNVEDPQAETPFDIMEVYMYKGDKADDDVYAVSGGVIDGSVYDHLMTYLGERGVDGALVGEMMTVATQHEHKQYIALLGDIGKFVA